MINVGEWGTVPIGSLLGGVLGQALGLRPALFALAAAGVAASLPWVAVPAVRDRYRPGRAVDSSLRPMGALILRGRAPMAASGGDA